MLCYKIFFELFFIEYFKIIIIIIYVLFKITSLFKHDQTILKEKCLFILHESSIMSIKNMCLKIIIQKYYKNKTINRYYLT